MRLRHLLQPAHVRDVRRVPKLVDFLGSRYDPLMKRRRHRDAIGRKLAHSPEAYPTPPPPAERNQATPPPVAPTVTITRRLAPLLAAFSLLASCTPPTQNTLPKTAQGRVREGTPPEVNIAEARTRGLSRVFEWSPWSQETFERARREKKFILLDGAAEWCHWCHVMDETTYNNPEVGRILRDSFITIRVDIDARPDIAERYGDWGWPATILFTPAAEEIGKYRGYLAPDELLEILRGVQRTAMEATQPGAIPPPAFQQQPPPVEALGWIGARVAMDMDDYFDRKQGSWGQQQKSPLGPNIEFEILRHAHGEPNALLRAVFTLEKQRALIDPTWGGIYQYSAGSDWADPHYEKLMAYQAENIEAYARAYAATQDQALLADARRLESYIATFLTNHEGAFLVSQDADVGAHDPSKPFIDGHEYYRLDDAGRRALGVPRIDPHVYGNENGIAIAALCTLHEVSRDAAVLGRARRAADVLLRTHVTPEGAVIRPGKGDASVRYLADAASFGRALARLAQVTGEATYREAALRVVTAMLKDLDDPRTGRLWGHTPDPAAAGIFARRDQPFAHNVMAARFLGALSRTTGDTAWRDRGRRLLAAISTPRALADRGRMVGEYLLALDEVGAFTW